MTRALPFLLALGLASSPAAAEPPVQAGGHPQAPVQAPVAPHPGPPPAVSTAETSRIELTHIGVAAIAGGVFSAGIAGACAEGYAGSGLVKCQWAASTVAVGLGVASVPFLILGVRQDRVGWIADRATVVAGPRGVTLGWAARF